MAEFQSRLLPGERGVSVGTGPGSVVDQNSGRPGRQYQWSIGLQREITKDLVVEASYVANRQIWLTTANLVNYNFISQDRLQSLRPEPQQSGGSHDSELAN